MKVDGSYTMDAPREQVFETLQRPEALRSCLPGVEKFDELGGGRYEVVLKAGDAAGWKANAGNGHCLINRSSRDVVYIEVGTRITNETVVYSDIDMRLERDKTDGRYLKKTGEPYPPRKA